MRYEISIFKYKFRVTNASITFRTGGATGEVKCAKGLWRLSLCISAGSQQNNPKNTPYSKKNIRK